MDHGSRTFAICAAALVAPYVWTATLIVPETGLANWLAALLLLPLFGAVVGFAGALIFWTLSIVLFEKRLLYWGVQPSWLRGVLLGTIAGLLHTGACLLAVVKPAFLPDALFGFAGIVLGIFPLHLPLPWQSWWPIVAPPLAAGLASGLVYARLRGAGQTAQESLPAVHGNP
ncbi:MAG: hypothetical protein NVV62_03810 [Terricaulis sp.]|nr:hypothetical protein [Terricaulis sp.]